MVGRVNILTASEALGDCVEGDVQKGNGGDDGRVDGDCHWDCAAMEVFLAKV